MKTYTLRIKSQFADSENIEKIYEIGEIIELKDIKRVENQVRQNLATLISIKHDK